MGDKKVTAVGITWGITMDSFQSVKGVRQLGEGPYTHAQKGTQYAQSGA